MRFLEEFKERLTNFGLELQPDKTPMIEFWRYAARDRKQRGEGKPETFNFLGSPTTVCNATKPRPSPSGIALTCCNKPVASWCDTGCTMSAEPLKNLLKNLRATLTKLESASRPHDDGPAMAELKTNQPLRIATLEIALRRAEEPAAGKE